MSDRGIVDALREVLAESPGSHLALFAASISSARLQEVLVAVQAAGCPPGLARGMDDLPEALALAVLVVINEWDWDPRGLAPDLDAAVKGELQLHARQYLSLASALVRNDPPDSERRQAVALLIVEANNIIYRQEAGWAVEETMRDVGRRAQDIYDWLDAGAALQGDVPGRTFGVYALTDEARDGVIEAFDEADAGDVPALFKPAKRAYRLRGGSWRTFQKRLRRLEYVEFLRGAKGLSLEKALFAAADRYGEKPDTIRGWREELPGRDEPWLRVRGRRLRDHLALVRQAGELERLVLEGGEVPTGVDPAVRRVRNEMWDKLLDDLGD